MVRSHCSVWSRSRLTFIQYNSSITKDYNAKNYAFKSVIFSLKHSWLLSDEFDKTAFSGALQSIRRGDAGRVRVDWHCLSHLLVEFYSATMKYQLPFNVGLLTQVHFIYHRGNIANRIIFIKIGSRIIWNILIDYFNIRSSIANISNVSNGSFYLLNKNNTYWDFICVCHYTRSIQSYLKPGRRYTSSIFPIYLRNENTMFSINCLSWQP